MDKRKINDFLMELGGKWLIWRHNPPTASNMGGVREWQIRSARSVLATLLKQHGESLNDELLRTLLVEVEGIINSRPITCDNIVVLLRSWFACGCFMFVLLTFFLLLFYGHYS